MGIPRSPASLVSPGRAKSAKVSLINGEMEALWIPVKSPSALRHTILQKYGYHAVNMRKSAALFGQECGLRAPLRGGLREKRPEIDFLSKIGFLTIDTGPARP